MSDAVPSVSIWEVIVGAVGLAVPVMGFIMKAFDNRISRVEESQSEVATELRKTIITQASEHRNEISGLDKQILEIAGELRQAMTVQASDHRLAQGNIWTELRRMSDIGHAAHTAMADTMVKNQIALVEAMGKLPTREEVERGNHAMETRIMDTLRKEVVNR